jgi:hypothetical protein
VHIRQQATACAEHDSEGFIGDTKLGKRLCTLSAVSGETEDNARRSNGHWKTERDTNIRCTVIGHGWPLAVTANLVWHPGWSDIAKDSRNDCQVAEVALLMYCSYEMEIYHW